MFKPLPIKGKQPKVTEGFSPVPIKQAPTKPQRVSFEPLPISAKYPNLYGAYGAVKETGKSLIPYIKYIDPSEREKFMELTGHGKDAKFWQPKTKKQAQVKELLLQNLEAVAILGIAPIAKGAWGRFAEKLPKTAEALTKVAKTRLWGKKPTVPVQTPQINLLRPKPQTKVEMPKYAGSVNLERQAISNEAKRIELELFEKRGVKRTVTHDELVSKANKVVERFKTDPNYYAERVSAIKAGKTPSIEEEVAHRVMNATKFEEFVATAEGVANGTVPKAALDTMQKEIAEASLDVANPLAVQAGRRLSAYNIEVGKNRAFTAVGKLRKGLNKRQLKELNEVDWDNPNSVNQFVRRLPDPRLRDYFYEFWYNSILSGIPTHVVNTVSNTAWITFQIPHRILTSGVDKVISTLTGRARTRYLNEAIPMMGGYKTGAGRGAKSAVELVRHGKVTDFETKWAQEIGHALGAFDRSSNPIVRGVGKFITIPTKVLRAMDVMANSIAYDAHANVLARRASNVKGLAGKARGVFERKFVKNLSDDAHLEAMQYAKYNTFMDDPGWFSSSIIKLRGKIPGGRLVVPFVNTIGNLLKRGVEMTPGVGLSLAKGKNPSEVIAKQIEGAIVSMYVLAKCDVGEIIGAAPESKPEREAFYRQGKKAWSIRIGDQWYQYRRVEPFNTIIASAAIAYDKIKNAKDDEQATEIFTNMVQDFKNNLVDSSYLQGVTRILNRHGQAKGAGQRTASSLVPFSGFFRSINRAYEAHTEGSAKYRDTASWIGAFSTVIPGLSQEVPVKLNVWGKEIELEGGVLRQWLPYKWSTETEDPTELALEKLGVYPGHPSQTVTIKGQKVKLDDDIYRDYLIAYGHKAKTDLDKMFNKPTWKKALDKEKKHPMLVGHIDSYLTSIRASYRARAISEQMKRGYEKVEQ